MRGRLGDPVKFSHLLTVLGLNSVPALGWFVGNWPPGTMLLVYWFETVAASLLIAVRILLHRRLTDHAGHQRYLAPQAEKGVRPVSFLRSYLPVTLMFSGAHLVFLLVLAFVLTANGYGSDVQANLRQVGIGCGSALAWLVAGLLLDLPLLRKRPFLWLERMAQRNLGRVFVVHLTLIAGMAAAAYFKEAHGFFAVFVVLKTLADLSTVMPQYDPDEPPRWLCWIMDRVPNVSKKRGMPATFAEFWRNSKAEEIARIARNERPIK